jgi:hypothetical protein
MSHQFPAGEPKSLSTTPLLHRFRGKAVNLVSEAMKLPGEMRIVVGWYALGPMLLSPAQQGFDFGAQVFCNKGLDKKIINATTQRFHSRLGA